MRISVNGTIVNASLNFPSTVDWTTWLTVSQSVTLIAGTYKVRATAIGSSGPNIDQMFVHRGAAGPARLSLFPYFHPRCAQHISYCAWRRFRHADCRKS